MSETVAVIALALNTILGHHTDSISRLTMEAEHDHKVPLLIFTYSVYIFIYLVCSLATREYVFMKKFQSAEACALFSGVQRNWK